MLFWLKSATALSYGWVLVIFGIVLAWVGADEVPSQTVLAGGALWGFMYFGIDELSANRLKFVPWIGMPEFWLAAASAARSA